MFNFHKKLIKIFLVYMAGLSILRIRIMNLLTNARVKLAYIAVAQSSISATEH